MSLLYKRKNRSPAFAGIKLHTSPLSQSSLTRGCSFAKTANDYAVTCHYKEWRFAVIQGQLVSPPTSLAWERENAG